jgi:cytochrome c553
MKNWVWVVAVPSALVIYAASSTASTSTVGATTNNGAADGGNGDGGNGNGNGNGNGQPDAAKDFAARMIDEGRDTFRNDTFGDEAFWDAIQLDKGIETVSPKAALGVGLKVDLDALDANTVAALKNGKVNLDDPAVTATLLKGNAVVGVKAQVDDQSHVTSLGITCALCHSTVDDAFAPGVGHRLDGWPNRDLNVGAIVSLAQNLDPVAKLLRVDVPTLKRVLGQWGPGKFDAEVFMDGKALGPDGLPHPTLLPSAFGLAGVNLHTYTGWGSVTHWNAFVANLEMHGIGNFFDPRLDDAQKFPIAAANGFGHVTATPDKDQVTSKLAALHVYQLTLDAPKPPAGSFDAAAANRGKALFEGKAKCASCHIPPLYTEPGWNMHTPDEIGIDAFQANRAPDGRYRTTPLRGLWARMQAAPVSEANTAAKDRTGHGFYHDGRFATLMDVMNHYTAAMKLDISDAEKADVVEYLKSL